MNTLKITNMFIIKIMFFVLTFSVGYLFALGQTKDSINYTDTYGNKQGKWIEYDNGLKYEKNYKDNVLDGTQKSFLSDNIIEIIEFKNGLRNGKYIRYWNDNKIRRIVHFKNDTLHGNIIEYYYNGQVLKKGNYRMGKPHGKAITYYHQGGVFIIDSFSDGERNSSKSYFKNGQLKTELIIDPYSYKQYYRTGNIKQIKTTEYELKYSRLGCLKDSIKKVSVNPVGRDTLRGYESKTGESLIKRFFFVRSYLDGKPNGVWRVYYPNGKLYSESFWEEDKDYSNITYFKNGKIKSKTFVKDDVFLLKTYSRNGELKDERIVDLSDILNP